MSLNREQRLAYVLDAVFDLSSKEAATVVGVTPEAYRQRLSRARSLLDNSTVQTCGLASAQAACRCERQLPALSQLQAGGQRKAVGLVALHRTERDEAERIFAAFTRVGDAAALFRAHPACQARFHRPQDRQSTPSPRY